MNEKLRDYILEKIALKQEGASWDFKRQWYSAESKCDLLHDIICMANLTEHSEGHIIIGVDEENDYSVSGVENDVNRKNTQSIVTFLRDKEFASGNRPVVYVETLEIDSHLVDVIVIEDSTNTPYYLSSGFQGVRPFHIYTRVQDTNTDITKSADPDVVEKLWRKRFGIDRSALDRAFLYLKHPEEWLDIDDETGWFYKYAPEFTVHYELIDLAGYEYYHCTQTDPTPGWYDIVIRYHQTVIYKQEGVSMDGGRYLTACPHFDILDVKSPSVKFSYYIESDENYILFEFFNEKHLLRNDRLAQRKFLEIVPIFSSELEKTSFWEYVQKHFYQLRPKYNYEMLPPFAQHVSSGQSIDALKNEYLDAMVCMTLLNDFRDQSATDICIIEEDEVIDNDKEASGRVDCHRRKDI